MRHFKMTCQLFKGLKHSLIFGNFQQYRHAHRVLGKMPVLEAKTLQQVLSERNWKDPELHARVDIGFKPGAASRTERSAEYMAYVKQVRKNPEMERKARMRGLSIDLEETKEDWFKGGAGESIKVIADHYNIFKDLFEYGYFCPVVRLDIKYVNENSDLVPVVQRGNILKPSETQQAPTIKYNASPDSLWTLLLTTPDGNLTSDNLEYCHWLIGNIPGNDISKGEMLIDYLRPIAPQGIGFCRYIFVLFKQDQKIDYSKYKKEQPCLALQQRNWKTPDFYRNYQDIITPAGLAFFQADWDPSLRDYYHHTLQMKSPKFEYDFLSPYIKPQKWFPLKEAFNLYLDRYRDPKEINKEYLLDKFKKTHPFRSPLVPYKYPNAHKFPHSMPSWLKDKLTKDRLGLGRIKEIEE